MLSALRYQPDLRAAHEFLADYFQQEGRADLAQSHRDAASSGLRQAVAAP
jgi:hypothetical protein